MAFCDFCDCETCRLGEHGISHAQTASGKWICEVCWRHDVCVRANAKVGIYDGPCETLDGWPIPGCPHRPLIVGPWTTREEDEQGTTESNDMKWKMKLAVRDGHRYFAERGTGRIALADTTGAFPDTTKHGLLYLDLVGTIIINDWEGADMASASLPLRKPDGTQCWAMESPANGVLIASTFGMHVSVLGSITRLLRAVESFPKSRMHMVDEKEGGAG